MTKTKKIIITTSVLLVFALLCIFTGVAVNNASSDINDDVLNTEIINSEFVTLTSSPAFASESGLVSKTITATVTPAEAINKNTTWSMSWSTSRSENINDYLTIAPSGANNNTLTVTCKKPFPVDIIIKCQTEFDTREAYCTVKFVGVPSEVNTSGNEDIFFVHSDYSAYILNAGVENLTWTINPTNVYNQVGDSYKTNFNVKLRATGNVILVDKQDILGELVELDNAHAVPFNDIINELFKVSSSGSNVTLTVKRHILDYYREKIDWPSSGSKVKYTDCFKGFDAGNQFIYLDVTVPNTDLKVSIPVKWDISRVANNVALSNGELVF